MKIIPYETRTGKENMQIDSDLLDFAIKNELKEPISDSMDGNQRVYHWEEIKKMISLITNY